MLNVGLSKNGNDWASFSLKVTDVAKDKSYIRLTSMSYVSAHRLNSLNKTFGDELFVQGSLQTNSYEDKQGNKVQRTQLAAKKITSTEDPDGIQEPLFTNV
jgi:single-stranded DNA-binding protein